ncbi:hypothetical protein FACS1894218_5440 [Bacilli bacterium]|nr:hypothetical protein FACS1894218_5440 [Bacilli bacterium]
MNYTVSNKKGNIILDDDLIVQMISSLCDRMTNVKLESISYKKDNSGMYYFYLFFAKVVSNSLVDNFNKIEINLKKLIKSNAKLEDFMLVLNANN